MIASVDQWIDEVAERVLGHLHDEALPVEPKHVQITVATDAFDDEAWRLLLVLPAPSAERRTWDREAVFKARRAAISAFDDFAAQAGRVLPGRTVASVTTDEATEADTAPDDEPEAGEDPGHRR